MADIQPGDHIVVRGGLQNNAFVPKAVIVLSAEQWERMQQFAQRPRRTAGNTVCQSTCRQFAAANSSPRSVS